MTGDPHHPAAPPIVVAGGFGNLVSSDVRLLDEASRLGPIHVRLWSDGLINALTGARPRFSESERRFFVGNLRYVAGVAVVQSPQAALRAIRGVRPGTVVTPEGDTGVLAVAAARSGIPCLTLGQTRLAGWPAPAPGLLAADDPAARRVLVTGCFDWLHSGHVEFFREAAALGELTVVVGSDKNVRLLKGDGHPLHNQDERAYMVRSMRPVHRAMVSTGSGWMDAEPEIDVVRPDIYLVNEDGDQPEKRDFCRAHGLEYVVLRRRPHPGLPRRTSTDLRGF